MGKLPEVGSKVRLINRRASAKVIAHMDQKQYPGGIQLDRRLDGFRYWNKLDVEPSPSGDLESK